jgi:hypothetical protein
LAAAAAAAAGATTVCARSMGQRQRQLVMQQAGLQSPILLSAVLSSNAAHSLACLLQQLLWSLWLCVLAAEFGPGVFQALLCRSQRVVGGLGSALLLQAAATPFVVTLLVHLGVQCTPCTSCMCSV